MSPLELTLLYLLAAVLGVVAFRTMKLPPMLGYLAVGVVIGPNALALAENADGVRHLGEFGVVFLMFDWSGVQSAQASCHAKLCFWTWIFSGRAHDSLHHQCDIGTGSAHAWHVEHELADRFGVGLRVVHEQHGHCGQAHDGTP